MGVCTDDDAVSTRLCAANGSRSLQAFGMMQIICRLHNFWTSVPASLYILFVEGDAGVTPIQAFVAI